MERKLLIRGHIPIQFMDLGISMYRGLTDKRHLAAKWEGEMHIAATARANNLSSIDLLVLFDLLGAANPRVPSYFPTTHWAYAGMSRIEKQLRDAGILATGRGQNWLYEGDTYGTSIYKGGIEDDHLPFLHRGVEILHIIPVRPKVVRGLIEDTISKCLAHC